MGTGSSWLVQLQVLSLVQQGHKKQQYEDLLQDQTYRSVMGIGQGRVSGLEGRCTPGVTTGITMETSVTVSDLTTAGEVAGSGPHGTPDLHGTPGLVAGMEVVGKTSLIVLAW